ncbi:MAG: prepilin-type N-terminal cleavage/methylation domain-containing protein [Elusimicrobiaceae bacterium]|nr:prepilin-type N-terminal cleavage/methylation domain-containing protein [Elusimicrobiaceae bacterium]
MVQHKQAFTLIELLVVVLIIGILAAVALPQYQLAVLKARGTKALVGLDAMAKMQQTYFLANGYYAEGMDSIDFEYSTPISCGVRNLELVICFVVIDNFNRRIEYHINANGTIKRKCMARLDDALGNKWCQLYGSYSSTGDGFKYYSF